MLCLVQEHLRVGLGERPPCTAVPRRIRDRRADVLPSFERAVGKNPRNAPRRLSSLTNFYASLFGPILPGNATPDRSMCAALAHAIKTAMPAFDVVQLHPPTPPLRLAR